SMQVVENLYPSRSSDGSVGWIRRFDEKVPVFRLSDQLYGSSRTPSRSGVIMVLRRNERLWALLVDKVTASAEVPADRFYRLPAVAGDADNGQFPAVVVEDEGLSLYIAPERLVPAAISGVQAPPPRVPTLQSLVRARASAPRPSSARRNAETPPSTGAARQIITFSLETDASADPPVRFGISAGQAIEILNGLPVIPVPNAPSFVAGLALWRSQPVPVVDLGGWMGTGSVPYKAGCRLLICRGTQAMNGALPLLAIPAVDQFRKLDLPIEYKSWPHRPSWNTALALGIYQAERSMLIFPDLDAIASFQAPPPGYRM
ncbi:MAG: chemotaxis protein CheW, partial [Bryobacterales bacterium]|nr:chemotaxis protein CheW [Bryobacterales bacterium]